VPEGAEAKMPEPILPRLTALYRDRGIDIVTGLNPSHFDNFPLAPFTWFVKNGDSLTNGLGIGLQEIYFLECLFARFRPHRLFVIGNALGWSSLALGLLNPQGRVLAIDAGLDRSAAWGIELTNSLARAHDLPVLAITGRSPDDVPAMLRAHRIAPVEFVLIDGYHSVEQVGLDFAAIRPDAAPDCLYLFHDVESFDLHAGIERITAQAGLAWELLLGTTSGMAVVYDPTHRPGALDQIAPFIVSADMVGLMRRFSWNHRHRHLARWRRSLRKRFGGSPTAPPPKPALAP
jgi:hypothetical protein